MGKKAFYISATLLFFVSTIFAQKDLTNLAYGKDKQQTVDLFLPSKLDKNTPVIILLHGGAWSVGGKEYTYDTSRDLRDRGFVVANVDYRYVGPNVHADKLLDDIDNAVKFVQAKSKEFKYSESGYHFSGISAGAHLATLYSYTRGKNIKSIAVLCGPTKLNSPEILDYIVKLNLIEPVQYLANATYTPGSGIPTGFTEVSPSEAIKNIPTLLFHGDKDDLVPFVQAEIMIAALQKKGVTSDLVTQHGFGHDCGMNDAVARKRVLDGIEKWVRRFN